MANDSTLLSVSGMDLSPYATRDLTMTLEMTQTGEIERDIDGNAVDMTIVQFDKYRVTVACTDHEAPPLTGIRKGSIHTVVCIPSLGVEVDTDGTLTLAMMLEDFNTSRQEAQADTAWFLAFIEV
jgi:hypothetical protein